MDMPHCQSDFIPLSAFGVGVHVRANDGEEASVPPLRAARRARLYLGDFRIDGGNAYGLRLPRGVRLHRMPRGFGVGVCAELAHGPLERPESMLVISVALPATRPWSAGTSSTWQCALGDRGGVVHSPIVWVDDMKSGPDRQDIYALSPAARWAAAGRIAGRLAR